MNIDAYTDWLEKHDRLAGLAAVEEFMSVRIGDEVWTGTIDQIRRESPLFDSPRVSWWRRLLAWLRVEPLPAPVAVLPTLTIDEPAGVDALEKTLAVLANALAAIEDMESDPA